jgi:outer membrane murein-binding lipoprotein Lpp
MMDMNRFTSVVIAVVLAAGCSKAASDRPAGVSDDMVATADKYAGALEKFASDLEAAGSDCGKALDAVKASSEIGQAIAANVDVVRTKTMTDPAAKEWFKKAYESRMKTAFEKVKSAANACESDATFKTAIEADELLPRKRAVKTN